MKSGKAKRKNKGRQGNTKGNKGKMKKNESKQ
jgi:hypothetical protein